MARGRMIDNCISISEKINDLSLKEAFIYTWIIPHLDDWGRITGSPRTLKALVFPMKKEISIKNIEDTLKKFKEMGLFLWEEVNGEMVLQMPFEKFNSHQSISDAKRAKSKYPEIIEEIEHKNDISQEMPEIPKKCQENPAQDKIREDKIREDNKEYTAPDVLSKSGAKPKKATPKITFNREKQEFSGITENDIDLWVEAYPAVKLDVEIKKMIDWILSAGPKGYKSNWRKFITNWFSRCQDRGGTK